jgi:uncharacterized protein YaaQ
MRKLMTVAMGFAAMLLASCAGSTTENNNASVEADVQEKMETILSGIESNDVDAVVATLEETKEKVEELLAEGKIEEAQEYAEQIKAFYEENVEQFEEVVAGSATISELVKTVTSVPTEVEGAVDAAADYVQDKVDAAEDKAAEVKDAIEAAPEAAKAAAEAKAEEVKEEAKAAAEAKVEEGKQAAKDAASKAIEDAANKLFKK